MRCSTLTIYVFCLVNIESDASELSDQLEDCLSAEPSHSENETENQPDKIHGVRFTSSTLIMRKDFLFYHS